MPMPIAIAMVVLISACLLYVGGYVYLIILALILKVFKHLSTQANIAGKWGIDRNVFVSYLVIWGLLVLIVLSFLYFTKDFHDITICLLLLVGACCYFFFMSLKKNG